MRLARAILLSVAAILALAACETWRYAGAVDKPWLRSFSEHLPATVAASDAIVVGSRVCSLGHAGKVVTLFRVGEVLKGRDLVVRAMAGYTEAAGSVTVAYDLAVSGAGHLEPAGETILFMTAPRAAGKNMHLLGDRVDDGMIYALPSVVRKVRGLCNP